MINIINVVNTDQVNKRGYRFTVGSLLATLSQTWRYGTGSFISHDFHRPLGWSKSLGMWIMPNQVALVVKFDFPETEAEAKIINQQCLSYAEAVLQDVPDCESDFLKDKFSGLMTSDAVIITRECTTVVDGGIAKRAFPELFPCDETDKNCLLPINDLKLIAPGVFEYKGVAIFAHRFFRRNLSQFNNFNDIFLRKLFELPKDEISIKISLDPDSIGILDNFQTPIELDYWWGPSFTDCLEKIELGVSRHEATDRQRLFSGISRSEFWWHMQNGIKSFECEEIRNLPTANPSESETYGCRYVHSMVDDSGVANHLDGAIRLYDEERFLKRLDMSISNSGKNTEYYKLWRIDGEIKIDKWKELISDYYKDNHLVGEYFLGLGAREDANCESELCVGDDTLKYVQPPFLGEYGPQILFSYQEHDNEIEKVSLVPDCRHLLNGTTERYIELGALEYVKLINAQFLDVTLLGEEVKFFAFEDMDVNLPLVIVRGSDAVSDANEVINCLQKYINLLSSSSLDRIVTASIGITYGECIVKFSFIINLRTSCLNSFFKNFHFPECVEEASKWMYVRKEEMCNKYEGVPSPLNVSDYINNDARFYVKRHFLKNDTKIVDGNLQIKFEDEGFNSLFSRRLLTFAPCFNVSDITCEVCGGNHLRCECLHNETHVVSCAELIGFFATRENSFGF